jgi:hypothetical protein
MVGCGLVMLGLAWLGSYLNLKQRLERKRLLLWLIFLSFPLPFRRDPYRPELAARSDESVVKNGRRLEHAEGTSHPIRPSPEREPRGARIRGNRRVSQS